MSLKDSFSAALKNALPKKSAPMALVKKKGPGPDPAATATLLAWRSPAKNARILIAYKPGTDPENPNNLVTVNVASNINFLPHMRLPVQLVQGTIYDLVGPLPRWRGKW